MAESAGRSWVPWSDSARFPPHRGAQPRAGGVPERVAMQLIGHKTRAVFERNNIVSSGDLRDAAQRIDAYASAVV